MSKHSENVIRTIRASANKVDAVLDQIEAAASPRAAGNNRRTAERYIYRYNGLVVQIQQPGETAPRQFAVEPRNLSSGGIAFLHGGFVHAGSTCNVHLISLHEVMEEVTGTVVACRYVDGGIHEVGVKFSDPIEPAKYCREATSNRVLLVDDDPAGMRLANAYLTKLNAEVDQAEDGRVAVEKAIAKVYDLILMDVEMPELDGLAATQQLRSRGYTGRIVAATAKTQPGDREKCLQAGCDDYISKPITIDNLTRVLESLHQKLLFSSLAGDPSMVDLVNTFISELPARIREIEEALVQQDSAKLEIYTRALKAQGTGYGFAIITKTAAMAEALLCGGVPLHQAQDQINDLIKLCLQVRSSARQTSPST